MRRRRRQRGNGTGIAAVLMVPGDVTVPKVHSSVQIRSPWTDRLQCQITGIYAYRISVYAIIGKNWKTLVAITGSTFKGEQEESHRQVLRIRRNHRGRSEKMQ